MALNKTPPKPVAPASAIRLARAVQNLRNQPAIGRAVALRRTPAYEELCDAWKAFVEEYPDARRD